jgi:hypothetical protein
VYLLAAPSLPLSYYRRRSSRGCCYPDFPALNAGNAVAPSNCLASHCQTCHATHHHIAIYSSAACAAATEMCKNFSKTTHASSSAAALGKNRQIPQINSCLSLPSPSALLPVPLLPATSSSPPLAHLRSHQMLCHPCPSWYHVSWCHHLAVTPLF